jgi:hypothetical protein
MCRNCCLKHDIGGKVEGMREVKRRRDRRRQQILNDYKKKRRYWEQKQEALDHTLWKTSFGRGYGNVVEQTTE